MTHSPSLPRSHCQINTDIRQGNQKLVTYIYARSVFGKDLLKHVGTRNSKASDGKEDTLKK